ncbi:DeoR/GlpR family DNA-binding transcription regulator [Phaeovulum sp. W22_SRMD_FR3]|uniref:DeoR/GlpR family DNA-binding transcription regulator n=1 Tax=Phaeovulum sp. W22_SRMD_FR3 TaxID=3240274 RepID=UPI003F99EBBE
MSDTPDLPLLRRQRIAGRLRRGEAVTSIALAQEFQVSEDAIRRDLRGLAADGICQRVYGGALPLTYRAAEATGPVVADRPVSERLTEDLAAKRALAAAACDLIRPGQTLFLDNGSTIRELAQLLPRDSGLRVVTNSVPVAAALMAREDLWLYLIGGVLRPRVGGAVDQRARAELGRFHFDLCFLGACAMTAQDGLMGIDMDDVDFKRALLVQSAASVLMMTNAKLGSRAPFAIAPLSAVSHYILEPGAPTAEINAVREAGSQLIEATAVLIP